MARVMSGTFTIPMSVINAFWDRKMWEDFDGYWRKISLEYDRRNGRIYTPPQLLTVASQKE